MLKLDDGWPESEERCSEICKSEDGIAWSIKREIYQDISEKKRYKKWYIRCEDMKRWRCKMRKKILKMWRGEDVKRRRCYDMKIWGYDVERWAREDLGFDGGVKIWRDGDVRMRKKILKMWRGSSGTLEIAILPQFLTLEPRFVREGFIRHTCNRNFTSVFDTRTSFRARGLTFPLGTLEIAILPQFLTLEPRFVREGWRFVIRRRHCPRPKERKKKKERVKRERETERREREREREKERENVRMWGCEDVKMWRCEDVKMWRCGCEDVKMCRCEDMRMWRCEDVKMWGCEDVKMWWCEDVKMWRCEDVKLWRCEDVMMWRCESMQIQLLEEPFAQTLSGKKKRHASSGFHQHCLRGAGGCKRVSCKPSNGMPCVFACTPLKVSAVRDLIRNAWQSFSQRHLSKTKAHGVKTWCESSVAWESFLNISSGRPPEYGTPLATTTWSGCKSQ